MRSSTTLRAGTLEALLQALRSHDLDVVLSHRTPAHVDELVCRAIAAQEVSLVGPRGTRFRFPGDLARVPLLVPGHHSEVRQQFDACKTPSIITRGAFTSLRCRSVPTNSA